MSANRLDLLDQASELSKKLEALLVVTYGESGEALRCLNNDLQDAYMAACSGMATELKECIAKLH